MSEPEPVLVAGGGIGGLTAAIALHAAGLRVRVLERVPSLEPVGAGITVQINAMLALRRLGIDEAVAKAGNVLRVGVISDARGRVLGGLDMAPLEAELGAPLVAIHRGRLQQTLLAAAGADCVETEACVASYAGDADGVTVRLDDGRELRGCALVGADGLRSTVRARLLGDGEPRYAGYTSWRGVGRDGGRLPRERAVEAWGRGQRFGVAPIDADSVYWFAVATAARGGQDPPGGSLATLRSLFAGWLPEAALLLEATREEDVVRTDCCDRAFDPRWGEGRVTLLGDAAHAMTPNLGQGGCQAIEDAVALGECLGRATAVDAGLREYERRRIPRARWFVEQSWRFGRVAQARSPLGAWLRNALVRLTPPSATERTLRRRYRLPDDGAR